MSTDWEEGSPYPGSQCCESPLPDSVRYDEPSPSPPSPQQSFTNHATSRPVSPLPVPTSPVSPHVSPLMASLRVLPPTAPSPPEVSQPGTSADGNTGEIILDDDILLLLGDAPKTETTLGPSIHKDVARRWQDILAKGLSKEVKENILKEYLIPSNCDLLLSPALNPEVKAALHDSLVKRDASLLYRQNQLGIALSALAAVTEMVISNETSKQKILKPLSDACRLLCDSHFSETNTRRKFVISSINLKLKQALIESNRDKSLLFGENISEKLKAAKTIQQSGDALKNTPKPKFHQSRPNVAAMGGNNKGRLNFVAQHRKTDNKLNDGRRVANYTQRQSTNNNAKRPNDRSLPSKTATSQRR